MKTFYMPWIGADFDRKTVNLNRYQKECYRRLLEACFHAGGVLIDKDRVLARICDTEVRTWRKHRELLLEFFYRTDEGWRQVRIDEDIKRIEKAKTKRQLGAR